MLPPGEFHGSLQSPEPALALLIKPSAKCFGNRSYPHFPCLLEVSITKFSLEL